MPSFMLRGRGVSPPESVVVIQPFSCVQLFEIHGLQHTRLPCPSLIPAVWANSCPLSWWCHPAISSSLTSFSSCPQLFPASASLPMGWLFASAGHSIGASASASVLPMNIQDWFPLGLTGLISLQSRGLSRVFCNTTVQKHQFVGTYPLHCSGLENSVDCIVQGVAKSWTQLSDFHFHFPAFFMIQLAHPYMTTGKIIALTRRTFVGKVMSLLFNMMSRFVIALLPRSKHLLISWLQSPSAVILEPQNKVCHCFHCFPIYLPWS